jgi:hypothetical protein
VRELGADEAVDFRATRFEAAVGKVDVVIDVVGGETQERSFAVLKSGGVLVERLWRGPTCRPRCGCPLDPPLPGKVPR